TIASAMVKRKLMVPATDGKAARVVNVAEHGSLRLYVLASDILSVCSQTIPNSGVTSVTGVTPPSNPSVSAPFSALAVVTPAADAGVTGVTSPTAKPSASRRPGDAALYSTTNPDLGA